MLKNIFTGLNKEETTSPYTHYEKIKPFLPYKKKNAAQSGNILLGIQYDSKQKPFLPYL